MNNTLKDIMTELEDLFSKFNSRYYQNQLQTPVITIHPDTTSGAFGWCTTWKAWKESKDHDGYYEINLCAEYLNRPIENTAATLLHEMAHLWNMQNGIQDCSRGNMYHNKKFKESAEQHGLIIEKHDKYGWTITTLNEDAAEFVKNELNADSFKLHRTKLPPAMKKSGKSSTRKYVCPECGMIIRATKEVNVYCGDCDVKMEEEF